MKKNLLVVLFFLQFFTHTCFAISFADLSKLKNSFTKKVNTALNCLRRKQTCDSKIKKAYRIGIALAGILAIAIATGTTIYLVKTKDRPSPTIQFDTLKLQKVLANPNIDINKILPNGHTLLTQAVYLRNPIIVKSLLNKGAQVDKPDRENHTPFYYAIFSTMPSAEIVKLLIQQGANIHITNPAGNTPLLANIKEVMSQEEKEIVQRLIQHGADISSQDAKGYTPLHKAVLYNHGDIVKSLMHKGANVNVPNKKGTSPLITASKKNLAAMVDILLTAESIDIHATNAQGKTALDVAGRPAIATSLRIKSLLQD